MPAEQIRCDDRSSWLRERRRSIGSSDLPAILGISPFASPLDVWAEKTGKTDRCHLTGNVRLMVGHAVEGIVLDLLHDETERTYDRPENVLWRAGNRHATPDAIEGVWVKREIDTVEFEHNGRCCEIKSVGAFAPANWREQIPRYVVLQLAHQMEVLSYELGTCAGLINGAELLWKDFDRNAKLAEWITEEAETFWKNHVVTDIPPEPKGRDLPLLRELFPKPSKTKKSIDWGDDEYDMWARFEEESKWRLAAIDEIKARFMMESSMDEELILPSRRRVTWKKTRAGLRQMRRAKAAKHARSG